MIRRGAQAMSRRHTWLAFVRRNESLDLEASHEDKPKKTGSCVTGLCLACKKLQHPRTRQHAYAERPMVVLGVVAVSFERGNLGLVGQQMRSKN